MDAPLISIPDTATVTVKVDPESIKKLTVSLGVMLCVVGLFYGLVKIVVNKI